MNKSTTAMWLLVAAVLLYAVGTLPSAAHGAPAPQTQEQPKSHVNPDGTAVLYIYQDLPPQPGEKIVEDPRAVPGPEADTTGDPFIDAKDPRTWA